MKTNNGHEDLKCFGCLMALEMEDGIWCLKFKGMADSSIARNCQDYVGKELISCGEGDDL